MINKLFQEKNESIQSNAALAMTGAVRGTDTEKLYQEVELESVEEIYKDQIPPYFHNLIPTNFQGSYSGRATREIYSFRIKHGYFKSSVFPSMIIEWNNLDYSLCNVPSFSAFKQNMLKFICQGLRYKTSLTQVD